MHVAVYLSVCHTKVTGNAAEFLSVGSWGELPLISVYIQKISWCARLASQ